MLAWEFDESMEQGECPMHGTCSFANGHSVNCIFTRKSPVLQGIFLLFKHKSVMIFLIIIIIAVTHAAFAAE